MKISHQEIMDALNLKSINTISHMKKNDPNRYQLICDGLKYRKIKKQLNTDDVEGVINKISEAIKTVSVLIHRIKELRTIDV